MTATNDPRSRAPRSPARRALRAFAPRRIAHAHSGTHSYAYVVVEGAEISGNIQFPIGDLNEVLSLSIPSEEAGALAALREHRETIELYAAEHLAIGTGASIWSMAFTGLRVLERKAGSYAILEYRLSGAGDPVPRRFTIRYDGIIHAKPHHEAIVIVKTSAGFGPLHTVTEQRLPFSAATTAHDVTIPEASLVRNLSGAFEWVGSEARELTRRARKRLRK